MKKHRGTYLALGVIATMVLLMASGCDKPTDSMNRAQRMIDKAKAAGALDKSDARPYLNSAEDNFDTGKGKMDKLCYAKAKDKFEQAYRDAKKAYDLAMVKDAPPVVPPVVPPPASTKAYDVDRGDCLWTIADNSSNYGDAFSWPLIYDQNRDKIDDRAKASGLPKMNEDGWAHWIFPDQVLDLPLNSDLNDVKDARRRAGAPAPYLPPGK